MGFLTHGFLMIFALNKPTPRASNSRVPIRSFDGPEIAPKMAAVWRIKTPATQCKLPANQQRSTEPKVGKLRWYYKSPRIYWNLLCFFQLLEYLTRYYWISASCPNQANRTSDFSQVPRVRCHSFSLYGRHEALHSGRSRWEPCESAP